MKRALAAVALLTSACLGPPSSDPRIIRVAVTTAPNSLDPRIGTDDTSQKIDDLIFDDLMELDGQLRVVPGLAATLERQDPLTYVATLRQGVRFHDGHEFTSADVAYTFRSLLDPALVTGRRAPFSALRTVEAPDRYTVVFRLSEPLVSFPSSLVMPIVPDGASSTFARHPIGTGPYRFVDRRGDDGLDLAAFPGYFKGPPKNAGLAVRIVPDEVTAGLELAKGTIDLVVNDVGPDIVWQLRRNARLRVITAPGTDYQYIGLNLRDPVLEDVRVRQALAYGIDRRAIVDYLRRGLAVPAVGPLPPSSWAFTPNVRSFEYDPGRARILLDQAGYPQRGRGPRLHLSLKVSNAEFSRLQAAVIQHNLSLIGVEVDVRTYEFATLYADVLNRNFQMYTLQWSGGALADPDVLRQIFHSSEAPPTGLNRGHFSDRRVDALLDAASTASDAPTRRELFDEVLQVLAEEVPYISLWDKTNYAIAQRTLTGICLSPAADFRFLQDVGRR